MNDHLFASGRKSARVVIVGGGFGGLACAAQLGGSEIEVVLLDRRNHNLFQPLLYQVATAALSPADIAEPIRKSLARFKNIQVYLEDVIGIGVEEKTLHTASGRTYPYDYLVLATGSDYNYFGNDGWRSAAPGLKSLREARQIRQRLLLAFEQAELAATPAEKQVALTSVVIGGGPTGVEMAGAISELGRFMIERDFRNLRPEQMRVLLIEAGPCLLGAFPEKLSNYAENYLRNIGVDVQTNVKVTDIRVGEVVLGDRIVRSGCIVWGAGVKASPAATWLGVSGDRMGRIEVTPMMEVVGVNDVYALGDTAAFRGADGQSLPALAQVAKQQGTHVGNNLLRFIRDDRPMRPFTFKNRGNTAVIGRNAAVFDFGSWQLKGRPAWILWALVHVLLLINFEKKILVAVQWLFRYLTRQRGARIIDEDRRQ